MEVYRTAARVARAENSVKQGFGFGFRVSGSEFRRRERGSFKPKTQDSEPETRNSQLFPFELRLPFLQKRADALVLVFGRKAKGKQIHFPAQTLVETRSRRDFDRFLFSLGQIRRPPFFPPPNKNGVLGCDDPAGEIHPHLFPSPNQRGKPLRP